MSKYFFILCFLCTMAASAQKSAWKRTGTAEKFWVLTHPFVVKKTYLISQKVLKELDSLKKTNYFEGNTLSGSKADAVRHAYWMASLASKIGKRRALKLGRAHEKKNKRDFKKGELEEQYMPDLVAIEMDLRNNEVGARIGKLYKNNLLERVLKALAEGELWWIKQNDVGDFLDLNGKVIPLSDWSGRWENQRVLVRTN